MARHTLAEIEYAYQELQWAWRLILSSDVQDWELLARIHAELGRSGFIGGCNEAGGAIFTGLDARSAS